MSDRIRYPKMWRCDHREPTTHPKVASAPLPASDEPTVNSRLSWPTAKQAFAVMTHNPLAGLRLGLVERTLASAQEAFSSWGRVLLDNGSTDGSLQELAVLSTRYGATMVRREGFENTTPGAGRSCLLRALDAELLVLSDDDIEWKPWAGTWVKAMWNGPVPDDLVIICGLLEPEWHWNLPRSTLDLAGGRRVLVRDSVPGAAWTVSRGRLRHLSPVPEEFGYDSKVCARLREQGWRVAACDLAEHIGWGASTHGNDANRRAIPLDRARWGV